MHIATYEIFLKVGRTRSSVVKKYVTNKVQDVTDLLSFKL